MPDEVILDNELETDNDILNKEVEDEKVTEEPEKEVETEETEEEDKEKKPASEDEDKPFPYERPSIQEIKAKYPDFFKDFPIFRDVVFRELEFTKVFPTIDDAKESLEDSITLSGLRDSVLAGKSEDVFDAVKNTDEKAAETFALTFLPTLYKKDNELYKQALTPVMEAAARNMFSSSDENVRNAAIVFIKHLWPGLSNDNVMAIVEGRGTLAKNLTESEDAKKLKEERQRNAENELTKFHASTIQELGKQRAALISRGLDPEKVLTEAQKQYLVKEIANEVDKQLIADEIHMKNMNARWLRATKEGFNDTSKEKIISAYLSRAKQVIPSIREKVKNDLLGARANHSRKTIENIDSKSNSRKEVVSGKVSGSQGSETELKPSKKLYREMSDIDILNS